MRIGVRADAHIDARAHVTPQITQRYAASRKDRWAMRNCGAGFSKAIEVCFGVPARGGVIIQENTMPNNGTVPKQPK